MRDTSERRQQISALVRERGSVQVVPLAERFGVSMQTIRKDLLYLAKRGVAERSYGGAIAADAVNLTTEPPVEAKRAANADLKSRIGRMAASLIRPGESVMLDSGTTTLQIAQHLPDLDGITVLTNDLDILNVLAARERLSVFVLGGSLRRRNRGFYGAQTEAALNDLHIDKLFLGVDGFDTERGITTHYEPEALLNRKMVHAAREVIAVADHTKFGGVCLHRIIPIGEIDALVTDDPVPAAIVDAAGRAGFTLHIS